MFNWSEVHSEKKYYLWNRDFSTYLCNMKEMILQYCYAKTQSVHYELQIMYLYLKSTYENYVIDVTEAIELIEAVEIIEAFQETNDI